MNITKISAPVARAPIKYTAALCRGQRLLISYKVRQALKKPRRAAGLEGSDMGSVHQFYQGVHQCLGKLASALFFGILLGKDPRRRGL